MKKYLVLMSLLISVAAQATLEVPQNLMALSGGFVGKTLDSKQPVRTLIAPKAEKPGTFVVVVMIGSSEKAILFDGELISGSDNMGLSAMALSPAGDEIEVMAPPVALLQVVYKKVNVADRIQIVPQSSSQILSETIALETSTNDVIFQVPEVGFYESKLGRVDVGRDGQINADLSALGIVGQFAASFDIAGVGVLRGISFDGNYQSIESETVSALMVGVRQGSKVSLIVGKPSAGGQPQPVAILRKK